MLSTLKLNITHRHLLVFFATLLFFSCQKDLSLQDGGTVVTPPDLSTKINSSVSGFVTDENNAAVMGASVQFGSATKTTDKYGYFEAKNVQVIKDAAVVTVTRPGYFKGIKTYIAAQGKSAFFRIKLIPKYSIGTINAASGGIIAQPNGFSVRLTAGSIVNASSNAPYTGTVNVAAYWINPTAADLANIMPGDLRGINTEGTLKLLQSFGMAAVELTGASGELLQIVNGQKATLTIPIPSSLLTSAPATIPLWYFDEAKGLWKQEGTATKTGNIYTGDVGHFSFWNCDMPANYVQFNCTLKNSVGNPLAYTFVKITVVGTTNSGYGYTDSSGYVAGAVPGNSNLLLEVLPAPYGCTLYSQAFATTNVNISLGIITIPAGTNNFPIVKGTVTNCANMPVTNGYIIVQEGNTFKRYTLDNTGAYSFIEFFCSLPQTITLIGEDIANAQQSSSVTQVINSGINTVTNIQACGVATQQFINYTINTNNYSFTSPADSFLYFNNNQSSVSLTAYRITPNSNVYFYMNNSPITVGGSLPLQDFFTSIVNDSMHITTPVQVNITEYGSVGQFMSGNFTGVLTGQPPLNTPYNVTCNFRIRRSN
jgi:hypothetical protein